MTAMTLAVPTVLAAGEGVTPTRKDRCSHRGKGFPLFRIQIAPKGRVYRKPLWGALGWVPPWQVLSI